jgi:hypothetical protein
VLLRDDARRRRRNSVITVTVLIAIFALLIGLAILAAVSGH